jgi:hypothetical protein
MSDWFNREDTGRTVVVKVPNPLNIHNAARIKELEERIERYYLSLISRRADKLTSSDSKLKRLNGNP